MGDCLHQTTVVPGIVLTLSEIFDVQSNREASVRVWRASGRISRIRGDRPWTLEAFSEAWCPSFTSRAKAAMGMEGERDTGAWTKKEGYTVTEGRHIGYTPEKPSSSVSNDPLTHLTNSKNTGILLSMSLGEECISACKPQKRARGCAF